MIPDLALQTAIVSGLRALKKDPRQLERLFANLPAPVRAQVREFLEKTPIHFTHGYPMEVPRLPSVTLLLRRDGEAASLLGQMIDPGPAEDEFRIPATRRGEQRSTDLIARAREPHFPEEVSPALFGEGEPVETAGRIEQIAYDVEVRAGDYFAAAFLYTALKAVLVLAVPALEAWGLHNLAMTGSDVQSAAPEGPEIVFLRVLSLSFQHVFDVHEIAPRVSRVEGTVRADAGASLNWQVTIA